MFEFSIFITLLVSIFIFYFTIYFNLKKELGDLVTNETENKQKIINREEKIKILNTTTFILLVIIIILYKLPEFKPIINNINPNNILNHAKEFILKILPFKKKLF